MRRARNRAPRLPVKVNGKRVLTVDVHSHCYFHEAINLMGDAADNVLPPVKGVPEHFIVIEQRLKEMDAMAIDMEVLSINPFWYGKERDTAAEIVKVQNEKLAELCASRPERFGAFASLTLQFPDLAVQQLETAIKKQGLRGAAIGGSVLGVDFADPKFHPGQGRGTGGRSIHPSAEHARTRQALQGQRMAVEYDRQSARHNHCLAAPDLRRNPRPLPPV
jgi:aminocarboxymuconate-semialdehyde decarboxylase